MSLMKYHRMFPYHNRSNMGAGEKCIKVQPLPKLTFAICFLYQVKVEN